ncbi:MAG: radical SAM protein [Candidatus Hodarchaeales archaeon]
MALAGLHFLLTYQCVSKCDHCFVWGSPFSSGVWTMDSLRKALDSAETLDSISSIFFEGGEPFLYYPILLTGLKEAKSRGYNVGVVSYPYWAQTLEDAMEWLRPLAEIGMSGISVSGDCFHGEKVDEAIQKNAIRAAGELSIPVGLLAATEDQESEQPTTVAGEDVGYGNVMYRGRAAMELAPKVPESSKHLWEKLTECRFESLANPGRVHVDPYGNMHICQGIVIGNLLERPLADIMAGFDPHTNPILKLLLAGGPAALVKEYDLPLKESFADACELCYHARIELRSRFPSILQPDQMYGQF